MGGNRLLEPDFEYAALFGDGAVDSSGRGERRAGHDLEAVRKVVLRRAEVEGDFADFFGIPEVECYPVPLADMGVVGPARFYVPVQSVAEVGFALGAQIGRLYFGESFLRLVGVRRAADFPEKLYSARCGLARHYVGGPLPVLLADGIADYVFGGRVVEAAAAGDVENRDLRYRLFALVGRRFCNLNERLEGQRAFKLAQRLYRFGFEAVGIRLAAEPDRPVVGCEADETQQHLLCGGIGLGEGGFHMGEQFELERRLRRPHERLQSLRLCLFVVL